MSAQEEIYTTTVYVDYKNPKSKDSRPTFTTDPSSHHDDSTRRRDFVQKITYFGSHGAIVVGKGGSYAKSLKRQFNLSKLFAVREPDGSQYFIVKGLDERAVNHAAIRVQELLLFSMTRKEQSQIETLDTERCSHEETRDQLQSVEQHFLSLLEREKELAQTPKKTVNVSSNP